MTEVADSWQARSLPDVFSCARDMMSSIWSHRLGVRHSVGVRRLGTERVTTREEL